MSQRGGGSNGNQRGRGGGHRQGGAPRKRGGAPPGFDNPPVTKRDIEHQQQQLKYDQERQADEEIKRREAEKRGSGLGVEQLSSYVKGTTGQLVRVPDLSAHWLDPSLQLPPFLPQDNLALTEERWAGSQAVLEVLDADLSRLLRQKYHIFWSHVIFDSRLTRLIDSFLRYARRAYDADGGALDPASTYFSVFAKLFKVLLRMSTNRESATDFMDARYFADLIYDKWLFDVPKLFDICTLYASYNTQEVSRLVSSLFRLQPKFVDDLREAAPLISRVLEEVERRLHQLAKEVGPQGRGFAISIRVSSGSSGGGGGADGEEEEDKVAQLCDVEYYLQDILATLYSFVRVHPESAAVFRAHVDITLLAQLYDRVLPKLCRVVVPNPADQERREGYLERAKTYLVGLGHVLLQRYYTEPLQQADRKGKGKEKDDGKTRRGDEGLADELMNVLQALTSTEGETSFIRDMGFNHPLLETLETVRSKMEPTGFDWVMAIIRSLCGVASAAPAGAGPAAAAGGGGDGAEAAARSGAFEVDARRASLISQVRDLFPELGEGFIAACLHEFGDNAEAVIDALLTNALPASLGALKRNMALPAKPVAAAAAAAVAATAPAKPAPAPKPSASAPEAEVVERRSVFDDDDKGLANVRVLHGKKKQGSAFKVMSQKEEVKKLRHTFEQYEYEDEYDDSYDSFQAVGDADGEGLDPIQPNPNRPPPRRADNDVDADDEIAKSTAEGGEKNDEDDDDAEDDDDEDGGGGAKGGKAAPRGRRPVANPVGAGRGRGAGRGQQPPQQQQQQRAPSAAGAARGGGGTGGRGRGRGGRGRGGPVGDAMSDRQKLMKDRHKARVANHNRKDRALRKTFTTPLPPST